MVTERFCNKEAGHLQSNKEKSKENDTESKQGAAGARRASAETGGRLHDATKTSPHAAPPRHVLILFHPSAGFKAT